MCDLLNSVYPNVLKLEFAVFHNLTRRSPVIKFCQSFVSVFSEAAWREAAVLRMSMTGSGASVLCTQNPQPYNICSSHRQREGDGTEDSRRGCFHPWTESVNYTLVVCVWFHAYTFCLLMLCEEHFLLVQRHCETLNYLGFVIRMCILKYFGVRDDVMSMLAIVNDE